MSTDRVRLFFGPHCDHVQCPLLDCRHGRVATIAYPCSDQEVCPACGPDGAFWDLAVQYMTAWLIHHFGTINAEAVSRAPNMPAHMIREGVRFAELLRDNPPRS